MLVHNVKTNLHFFFFKKKKIEIQEKDMTTRHLLMFVIYNPGFFLFR